MRRSRLSSMLLAASLALGLASPLFADQVVYFINGKAMMVKSVEKGEKFTVLEMDGGGRMGVPTDQIARIEEYVLSAPAPVQAAPAPAPAVVQAPAVVPAPSAAQPAIASEGRIGGIPANMPPAPAMIPGPGVGGRPTDGLGRGINALRPLDVTGAAVPSPGFQRATPQSSAGPAMGGPAGAYRGSAAARPNFNPAGRRFAGRQGMPGRGGRPPDVNRYMPPAAPAPAAPPPAQNNPPAQEPQPGPDPDPPTPAEEDPPPAQEPEAEAPPPTDPENETPDSETPPPAESETPDDSSGGAS